MADAEIAALDQPQSECCYARSDKYWITDPQGIAWETYHTLGAVEIYGTDMPKAADPAAERVACCASKPDLVNVTSKRSSCC